MHCRFEELLNTTTARIHIRWFALRWVSVRLALLNSALFSIIALIIFLLRDVVPTSFAGATFVYAMQVCCDTDRLNYVLTPRYVPSALASKSNLTRSNMLLYVYHCLFQILAKIHLFAYFAVEFVATFTSTERIQDYIEVSARCVCRVLF